MALTDMQAIGVFAILDENKRLEEERDALRDALSTLNITCANLTLSGYEIVKERDALRAVLREILCKHDIHGGCQYSELSPELHALAEKLQEGEK